jgi:hypothetical protein
VSGLGRRLSSERDLWRGVWQHVDTFLDRIGSAQDNDRTHAVTMCALFPVFAVIERARQRSVGYSLSPALPAVPGGDNLSASLASIEKGAGRIPGVEECEYACAPYAISKDDDGNAVIDDPPKILMQRSVQLAQFRDIKHGQVTLRTPTYEFGFLTLGLPFVAIEVGDAGMFPKAAREEAMNGDARDGSGNPVPANFVSWSTLRTARLVVRSTPDKDGKGPLRLSAQLMALAYPMKQSELNAIAATASAYAADTRADIAKLNAAKQQLIDAGIGDAVTGAIIAAAQVMSAQETAFKQAASAIANHGIPSYTTLTQWKRLLEVAEGTIAASGLPTALDALDGEAVKAMNDAVENRIGYPDGPLRQLRMLQWTLRFFWDHRRGWMNWRHKLVLSRVHREYLENFTNSLERVLKGQGSGVVYPGNSTGAAGVPLPGNTKVGKQILVGATEIPLSNLPDLSRLQAGRIAVIMGDRPTAAPVIDSLIDGKKLPPVRLKVPALAVSVETGAGLPGTPGLVATGTPIQDHYRKIDDDELYRGAHRPGVPGDGRPSRAADGVIHALIAHRSRLALVAGNNGGDDRPRAPAMVRPYPGIAKFELEGVITPSDNRLFLKALPPRASSGTGEQLVIAAPGEFLLLYGKDPDQQAWQTAIEVDRCVIVTGSEAKRDDGSGATPVPACCADDERVMVIYLRQMYLPSEVTQLSGAFLHRSFAGFGARSLMTRVMLPVDLDPSTSSSLTVGGTTISPRRDPELEVAWRVFDEWIPKETR